jgi:protein phosphatase 1 regulatory subunit 7
VDENDDADAAKKEAEFPYHDENGALETVYPLRGLTKLEELDLYDNSLKKVKGLEGLVGLKSVKVRLS